MFARVKHGTSSLEAWIDEIILVNRCSHYPTRSSNIQKCKVSSKKEKKERNFMYPGGA